MAPHRAFVVGWYGHGNLGDEAFKDAFRRLWPQVAFTFSDHVPKKLNENYDSLWIGGGSFLDNEIPGLDSDNIQLPVLFVGVGLGPRTTSNNQKLLDRAVCVVVRDKGSQKYCERAVVAPDLVFSLPTDPAYINIGFKRQIVILLNDFLTPRSDSPEWVNLAYQWFVSEFSFVCNDLIDQGYLLHFIPMCTNNIDDRRFSAAVTGKILNRSRSLWYLRPVTENELLAQISISEFVITQRFHGIIYSAICGTPFISIRAHDKMANLAKEMSWSGDLDYYGFTKVKFNEVKSADLLQQRKQLLDFAKGCNASLSCISGIVTKELSL